MSDVRPLLSLYDHARAHALPVVLATVVRTSGSTYRKAGARMMLCADGGRVGVVSGGCLEGDVARRAWFLKEAGAAELVRYDTGHGEDATYEFGLGCRGIVEVLLERLDIANDPPIVAALRSALGERRSSRFVTSTRDGSRVESDAEPGADAFAERVAPPTQLLIFGSGVDAAPVARIARAVGWDALVIDGRLRPVAEATRAIAKPPGAWQGDVTPDAHTAAVVMTHRMDDDAGYLRDLLSGDVPYVGCLGPASRTEALLDELAVAGFVAPPERRAAIRAPVGLDLGAESPEQIALSIVAEIQAAFADADGRPLREKSGPIHRRECSAVDA